MPKKPIDSRAWTGEIPEYPSIPPKFENTVQGRAYYRDLQRRKHGDPGFKLKSNIIAFLGGIGFFAGAFIMAQVIDLNDGSVRYRAATTVFFFVMVGLLALLGPPLNAIRYWRKATGRPPITALEPNGDLSHPLVIVGIILVVSVAAAAITVWMLSFR